MMLLLLLLLMRGKSCFYLFVYRPQNERWQAAKEVVAGVGADWACAAGSDAFVEIFKFYRRPACLPACRPDCSSRTRSWRWSAARTHQSAAD